MPSSSHRNTDASPSVQNRAQTENTKTFSFDAPLPKLRATGKRLNLPVTVTDRASSLESALTNNLTRAAAAATGSAGNGKLPRRTLARLGRSGLSLLYLIRPGLHSLLALKALILCHLLRIPLGLSGFLDQPSHLSFSQLRRRRRGGILKNLVAGLTPGWNLNRIIRARSGCGRLTCRSLTSPASFKIGCKLLLNIGSSGLVKHTNLAKRGFYG
jgi:hypothetical protein